MILSRNVEDREVLRDFSMHVTRKHNYCTASFIVVFKKTIQILFKKLLKYCVHILGFKDFVVLG